ncbi:MAG TPA: GAF domain-containing SpoIIE family protein phosphatase [Blastocatellia bacterium]|nr:GAF domain-containing SpoIIE family protein phosphatase [Blastocatellia bacterium]
MFPNPSTNDASSSAPQSAQDLGRLVNELSVEFISILDLDELIECVARRISEALDYKFFSLFLVDEARRGLVWKKAVGYKPEEALEGRVIPFDRSVASAAWREGHTINVGDVSRDSRYLPVATEEGSLPRSEIAVPLSIPRENRVVGVMTLESLEPNYFTREHERSLGELGNHLAVALEHARVYDELRRRTREMRTLIEIGHEIASLLDLDRLLNHIAALLGRIIDYEFLLVGLIDEAREELVWHVEEGYGATKREHSSRTKLSHGVVGRAVRERRTQIVGDVSRDPDYYVTQNWEDQGQRSEIAVPLIYEDKVIGVLALESSRVDAFDEYHGRLLENIANNLSIAVANARLYAEHVERERQLEREILMARDVQRAMIPDAPPQMKGFDIAARLQPALNLSGDFYDYIPLSSDRGGERAGILIGDVAGKGVRAAMGMAAARSILRSVARRGGGPGRILRDANLRLHRDLGRQLLLTLVYAVLDSKTRTLNYCNAGHNPPLLVKASGKWRALKTGGLLLGVFDKQQYKSETVHMEKGDVVLFFTDGLTDAHTPSPHRVEFGDERTLKFLLEHRHLRAPAIIDAFLKRVEEFTAGAHQHDDLTLVVIKAL